MKKYTYVGISFIILLMGIWVVPKIADQFRSNDLAVIGKVPEFNFTNQFGESISNDDYLNKVYVVEFFFTTCPTICPIMNRNMGTLQKEFYGNPDFGIASFTINPENDTPEVLKAYAQDYNVTHKHWHMLTGAKEKIYELANKGFNLYAGENSNAEGGFEHSGMFALIDKDGNIRSRNDKNGNPMVYYDGIEKEGIQMLKEDIAILLNEK